MSLRSSEFTFKKTHTFLERKLHAEKLHRQNPTHIPLIIQQSPAVAISVTLPKTKFLVPENMTLADLLLQLHKIMGRTAEHTLDLYFGDGERPLVSVRMGEVAERVRDRDGFVYATYIVQRKPSPWRWG